MLHKAERAIIMAAGMGTRMRPVTLDTPKPLVKVNGTPMIETIINGLKKNNIKQIYIVTGYKKEKFEYLKEKYSELNIILLENPYYNERNNISSMYVARQYLPNAIVVDGDQVITNDEILNPYFERSGYSAAYLEHADEWISYLDENGIMKECIVQGGDNGWQLLGVSRWSVDDGKRLIKHIEEQYEKKKNYSTYWDNIAIYEYPDEYELGIKPASKSDITEIDSIYELAQIDNSYNVFIAKGN